MVYTRRPEHWAEDTKGRMAFERKVRKAIRADGEFELLDSTDSYDEVDFELGCRGRRVFLEVKEKKQSYRERWVEASLAPEEHLFIIDELAVRKVVNRAPRAYVLVNDQLFSRVVIMGALELITVPKRRVNRSIDGGTFTYKGKWLVDLRHGEQFAEVGEALVYLKRRVNSEDEMWGSLACHGRYEGEVLPRF